MSYQALSPSTSADLHRPLRAVRFNRLARWISNATHPPLIGVVCVLIVALATASLSAWMWGAEYLVVAVLAPTLFVIWLVQRGEVSDVQLSLRHQRMKPYCAALVCMGIAALTLQIANAPRLLTQVAWANAIQTLILFVVTLRWKISAHAASLCCGSS